MEVTSPAPSGAGWKRCDVALDERVRLAVYEAGPPDAPPIVLLHGIGHWALAAWDPLMGALGDDYRLIAFDLPGFGDSSKPDVSYDLAFFTATLRRFVDERRLTRFALVGNSLGGMIAAQFAGESPARVAALGLIAPAGFLATPGLFFRAYALGPVLSHLALVPPRWFVRRVLERAMYDPSLIPAATYERAYLLSQDPLLRRAFGRVYAAARSTLATRRPLQAGFARYSGPVLLSWGQHDRYLPIAGLRQAARTYPNATVEIIEHGGHLPQTEEPASVARALGRLYPAAETRESNAGG